MRWGAVRRVRDPRKPDHIGAADWLRSATEQGSLAVKRFTILVLLVLASILMILVAPPSPRQAYAQGGQLSGITWSGQVLTNRTTTGATTSGDGTQFTKGYFPNYGFASHWLTYCVNNVATIAIQLEGSDGNGTWTQISEQGTVASGC